VLKIKQNKIRVILLNFNIKSDRLKLNAHSNNLSNDVIGSLVLLMQFDYVIYRLALNSLIECLTKHLQVLIGHFYNSLDEHPTFVF